MCGADHYSVGKLFYTVGIRTVAFDGKQNPYSRMTSGVRCCCCRRLPALPSPNTTRAPNDVCFVLWQAQTRAMAISLGIPFSGLARDAHLIACGTAPSSVQARYILEYELHSIYICARGLTRLQGGKWSYSSPCMQRNIKSLHTVVPIIPIIGRREL